MCFDVESTELIREVEIFKNLFGIFSASITPKFITLAYPSNENGSFCIARFTPGLNDFTEKQITGHNCPIRILKLNNAGTLVASASYTGQSIKLYDTDNYKQIYEFKRGSEEAEINCMNFSADDNYFLCSSNRLTIHIFCLGKKNPVRVFEKMYSLMKKMGDNEYVVKESSFAQVYVAELPVVSIVGINQIVAVSPFNILIGEFNVKSGGEGRILESIEYYGQ